MKKPKIVVLSGAGISAESGIPTFRASDGLWAGHRVEDVASPEGWYRNPELVLEFYNQRRKNALEAKPNRAHFVLAELEKDFEVVVITQNIDDLHEQAGSSHIIHLHGELFKVRSTLNPALIYEVRDINPNAWEIKMGHKCEKGSQLRPHIVWFGEEVPKLADAIWETRDCDYFIVVGTSLVVYPAASLVGYAPDEAQVFVVDPNIPKVIGRNQNIELIAEKASTGMEKVRVMIAKK